VLMVGIPMPPIAGMPMLVRSIIIVLVISCAPFRAECLQARPPGHRHQSALS
jgi:hypothetical protein